MMMMMMMIIKNSLLGRTHRIYLTYRSENVCVTWLRNHMPSTMNEEKTLHGETEVFRKWF